MPPGVTATAWATIVTAVTAMAWARVSGCDAARAISNTTADSRIQAATTATQASGGGSRTAAPPEARRIDHTRPATTAAAAIAANTHHHGPTRRVTSPGTASTASPATERKSAARNVTADASTGRVCRSVRRSTLVTRSTSPSRSGKTWLPSRLTCSAAHDWPVLRPGSDALQASARSPNAAA